MLARPWICSILVAAAVPVLVPARAGADWSNFGGDPARTGAIVSPSLGPPFDVLWSKKFPSSVDSDWPAQPFVSYPVIGNGEVFAVTWRVVDNAQVFQIDAFDEQTGATLWTYTDTDHGALGIQLALDGSRLFADGTDQGVIAFDASTGRILWNHLAEGYNPLVATGGVVYFTDFGVGAQEYALDESSGKQLWMTRMFNSTDDGPVIGNGLVYLVGGDAWDGKGTNWPDGYALDQSTGAIVWRDTWSNGGGTDPCSFTSTLSDDQLWSSQCGLNEFDLPNGDRLDPTTGASVGHYVDSGMNSIVLDGDTEMGLVEHDTCINIPDFECNFKSATLTAEDVKTGTQQWTFDGDGQLDSGLIRVNHDVYVGSATGRLYAVNDLTGLPVWSMMMPDGFQVEAQTSPPSGMAADGNILAVSAGNSLTVLTPASAGGSGPAQGAGAPSAPTSTGTPTPTPSAASPRNNITGPAARAGLIVTHGLITRAGRTGTELSLDLKSRLAGTGLSSIKLTVPAGLRFSTSHRALAHGIAVDAAAKRLTFAAHVSHGKLIIAFKNPVSTARITITTPAIAVAKSLAKRIANKKLRALKLRVSATDVDHASLRTTTTLRVH